MENKEDCNVQIFQTISIGKKKILSSIIKANSQDFCVQI